MSSKKLVIVESPAKARTLGRILGKEYNLVASMGHIRDLPKSRLGVDEEHDFNPKYVIPRDKSKIVKELKTAAQQAATIYLATDPDREGEAIAWHLTEAINSESKTYRRIAFHEITEPAIRKALKSPRTINMDLVYAQQARRVLDRLVGYKISPLLWRKVRRGLSAGRVQSVALRIIVERERAIEQFAPEEYWVIEVELEKQGAKPAFRAAFVGLASGAKLEMKNKTEADEVHAALEAAEYCVSKVKTKRANRKPPPPFITSTLQQEAWRKLRFSARQTMAVAQQLYEGLPIGSEGSVGLITYMRTDSVHVARSAITETREFIGRKYGSDFVPPHARSFATRVKGAQEAHEAIRPTRTEREPTRIKQYLSAPQFRLYQLIWQRMVASQMADAVFNNTAVDIEARPKRARERYLLRTASSEAVFAGFTVLYSAGRDEGEEDDAKTPPLPPLERGDALDLIDLFPEQRFTQPPPRFTEATLIKMLEQFGIGRPSTYAPILSTIQDREYVVKEKGKFRPTDLGTVVSDLLSNNFSDIVDVEFTAQMEEKLDDVANHERDWVQIVRDLYTPLEKNLGSAAERIERVKLPEELTDEVCPQCGKKLAVKVGRYGKFLACSGYPDCKYTRSFQLKTGAKCPECGNELVKRVSKKKRTFYGCSNYPECKFAVNQMPLPEPCPQCGGLVTVYRGKTKKCTRCDYKAKLEES